MHGKTSLVGELQDKELSVQTNCALHKSGEQSPRETEIPENLSKVVFPSLTDLCISAGCQRFVPFFLVLAA